MSDKTLAQLPLAINATGALLYGVQGGTDVAISAELLQQQMPAQGANLVYAGPSGPPGALPSFRRLVVNDIPDLSGLYLASTGGNLVATTINNSTIIGGSISGTTAVFDDNKFTIRDEADTTKQAKWEASGISAGTTRSYILPNENGTLTLNTADQALTNKRVFLKASAPAGATLRVPHGVPPLSPVNGDIWTTAGGMYARIDGTTIGPLASAQSGYVTSFNTRVGDITLNQTDVTNALGYIPWNTGTNLTTSANISAGTISDSVGNLRTGITSAASAASSANDNANSRVLKSGDTMTGALYINTSAGGMTWFTDSSGSGAYLRNGVNLSGSDSAAWWLTASGVYVFTDPSDTSLGGSGYVYLGKAIINNKRGLSPLQIQFTGGPTAYIQGNSAGGDDLANIVRNGASNYNLNWNGVINASGGFGPGSDPRLKDESSLKNVDNALEKVYNLNVRYGRYHNWYNPDGKERVFLMADEALKSNVPQAVLNEAIEKDGQKYDGWSADQMIALLVKAVQELTDDVAELRSALKENKNV